jgi:thiamine kinase-like enzyme
MELSLRTGDMPYETANVISKAIKSTITKYQGKLCDMSVMHGDFTPWNMFRQNDHLYVFDWEYAQRTCPIGLDKCHFLIQSYIFEKHWNTKQILEHLIKKSNLTNTETLRMYLMAVISIYVCRESKKTKNANIDTYLKLLTQLHE